MSVPIRILRLAISLGVVTGIPPAVSPSGRKHPALGYALFDHCLGSRQTRLKSQLGNIVPSVFTPVLAKHSKCDRRLLT